MDDQTAAPTRSGMPGLRYINGFLITAMCIHALVIISLGYMIGAETVDHRMIPLPEGVLHGIQATAAALFVGVAVILAGYPRIGAVISGLSSVSITPIALVGIAGAMTVWFQARAERSGEGREDTPTRTYFRKTDTDSTIAVIMLGAGAVLFLQGSLAYFGSLLMGLGIMLIGMSLAAAKRPFICLYDDALSILPTPVRQPEVIPFDQITNVDEDSSRITIHFDRGDKSDKFPLGKKLLDEAHVEELMQILKGGEQPQAEAGDGSQS